ncbi:hypothetical protein HK098_007714, partial [Nowakowskiella sp. JEL0407]
MQRARQLQRVAVNRVFRRHYQLTSNSLHYNILHLHHLGSSIEALPTTLEKGITLKILLAISFGITTGVYAGKYLSYVLGEQVLNVFTPDDDDDDKDNGDGKEGDEKVVVVSSTIPGIGDFRLTIPYVWGDGHSVDSVTDVTEIRLRKQRLTLLLEEVKNMSRIKNLRGLDLKESEMVQRFLTDQLSIESERERVLTDSQDG